MTEPLHDPQAAARFAARLLAWHATHGRHDLPWQRDPDAYRVWVSEIMLQQTQVATVIPYFERFMRRFPTLRALADAPEDEVLHHWTGLGYYARARNLQRAARMVRDGAGAELPRDPAALAALPGIGRSTAGAICAIAWGMRTPILDGNVKRVLARQFAIDGDPAQAATERRLWELAERLTPQEDCGAYTQAIMDLGATLCTRTRPACALCPLAESCRARALGDPARFPARRRRRVLPERQCQLLVIRDADGAVLLEKRPPSGIWGGLWSFPEIPAHEDAALACDRIVRVAPLGARRGNAFRHTFSHFHLEATPVFLEVPAVPAHVLADDRLIWYKPGGGNLGFAAPVKRLLDALHEAPDVIAWSDR
ncbi:MAG: Adenine DNA glycosylase [Pseudomonadales bacterium]|nr:Adenine DNA glycosylase [Pseudomonadales bacterium]